MKSVRNGSYLSLWSRGFYNNSIVRLFVNINSTPKAQRVDWFTTTRKQNYISASRTSNISMSTLNIVPTNLFVLVGQNFSAEKFLWTLFNLSAQELMKDPLAAPTISLFAQLIIAKLVSSQSNENAKNKLSFAFLKKSKWDKSLAEWVLRLASNKEGSVQYTICRTCQISQQQIPKTLRYLLHFSIFSRKQTTKRFLIPLKKQIL